MTPTHTHTSANTHIRPHTQKKAYGFHFAQPACVYESALGVQSTERGQKRLVCVCLCVCVCVCVCVFQSALQSIQTGGNAPCRAHQRERERERERECVCVRTQKDEYRVEGLEAHSTVLWHLKNTQRLAYLAKHAMGVDRLAPQVRARVCVCVCHVMCVCHVVCVPAHGNAHTARHVCVERARIGCACAPRKCWAVCARVCVCVCVCLRSPGVCWATCSVSTRNTTQHSNYSNAHCR